MPPAIIITLAVWTLAFGPAPAGPSPAGPASPASGVTGVVAARVDGDGHECVPTASLRRESAGDSAAPSARAEGQGQGQDDDDPTGRPRAPDHADGPEPRDASRGGDPLVSPPHAPRTRRLFLLHGRLTC